MTTPTTPTKPRALWRTVALAVLCCVPLSSLIAFRVFVLEAFRISSGSMSPTLMVGDQMFVVKTPANRRPDRGDVVVFRYPPDPTKDFVSRILGVGGDRVQVLPDGHVEINGRALARCALGPLSESVDAMERPREAFLETLGAHQYVVFQSTTRDPAEGGDRCTRTPCVVPEGQFLTIGDDRDNSYDGRFWGFVPRDLLVGRARWIWAPAHEHAAGRFMHDAQARPVLPSLERAMNQCGLSPAPL